MVQVAPVEVMVGEQLAEGLVEALLGALEEAMVEVLLVVVQEEVLRVETPAKAGLSEEALGV